jgi:hypothetical protein
MVAMRFRLLFEAHERTMRLFPETYQGKGVLLPEAIPSDRNKQLNLGKSTRHPSRHVGALFTVSTLNTSTRQSVSTSCSLPTAPMDSPAGLAARRSS